MKKWFHSKAAKKDGTITLRLDKYEVALILEGLGELKCNVNNFISPEYSEMNPCGYSAAVDTKEDIETMEKFLKC